jgi:hypothetical protein
MKNIIPALNKLQRACMDRAAPLSDIGLARKELFAAIRETIVGFVPEVDAGTHPAIAKERAEYLAKFDKLNQ